MRKIQFINGEYYHIYNRGVERRRIFEEKRDYLKFLRGLKDFNNRSYYEERVAVVKSSSFSGSQSSLKELSSFLAGLEKMVEIVAYSLNPNHFHLILKQLKENGIPHFMHKVGTSSTNYFNKKYNRSGSLFQGPYKAIHIDSNDYLLWLSGYVNGNIEIHGVEKAEFWPWSSYKNFLGEEKSKILGDISIILSQFNSPSEYKKFVEKVIEESKSKKEMEKYLLEKIK